MDITIEMAIDTDLDSVEQLYNDVIEGLETSINYTGWKKGVYPTREDAQQAIHNHELFVAKTENKIVGSVILNHTQEKAYSDIMWGYSGNYDKIIVIHTLLVHPSYSNLGIGFQLMNFVENYSRTNQMEVIRLDVYEKNSPAIGLYERCGFARISKIDLELGDVGLKWFYVYEKVLLGRRK